MALYPLKTLKGLEFGTIEGLKYILQTWEAWFDELESLSLPYYAFSSRRRQKETLVEIDSGELRKSISDLTREIDGVFQDIKVVGDYKLKEVQVQLQVSVEGGISFLAIAKAGAKGAITLTFSI